MDNDSWIPVSDRKPNRWQRVLVTVRYQIQGYWGNTTTVSTAEYKGNNVWSIDCINALPWENDEIGSTVTAWKPAPEEYKEE